jgi:hypothetical protein
MIEFTHSQERVPRATSLAQRHILSMSAAHLLAPIVAKIFELRTFRTARRLRDLPLITVRQRANFCYAFTWPNPDLTAVVRSASGDVVAEMTYAISPLKDRVYIFDFRVEMPHRRKAYGLAMLHWLATTYEMPMTAIKEISGARPFWNEARRLRQKGFSITAGLAISDMQGEAARWAHLKSEAHRLIRMRAGMSSTWSLSVEDLGG